MAALLLLWSGLTALAAVSAAAVEVYGEGGTQCDGLVQPRRPPEVEVCGTYYAQREDLVRVLAVAAAVLLLLAMVVAVRRRTVGLRPERGRDDPDVGLGAVVLAGLVGPLGALALALTTYVVVIDPGGESSQGLPTGWQHVGHAAGVVVACLSLRAAGLSRASALAAAAVGVPAVLLGVVVAEHLLVGTVDGSARVSGNPLVWTASGLPVVLALLAVVRLQRRGRAAPGPLLGTALVLVSVAATTVALLPQLLPAFRDARGGGPYPFRGLPVDTWLPLMTAPLVLSLLVVGATYARLPGR